MVLDYFGEIEPIEDIEKKTGIKEGKAVFTVQIAAAAALYGFRTEFYSKHLSLNEENLKLDFYKKYSDETSSDVDKINLMAKKAGVKMEEKTFALGDFLRLISEDSIPIMLLDWNVVLEKNGEKYQGHFVPVIGYDKENIYVHNQGFNNPKKFFKIKKDIFDKARKAKGTDEDFLVVYRR